jgi:nitric oxide dioxygenase
MLSAQARPYIDASVPVLREHGLTITRTFYRNMFAAHPELTQIFNMGNQANGSQQQSLASAVFAYAANIDNAEALGPVVSRIVHKHVSVGITADHYPIVGHHLLGAIQEVLGEAATPPLLAAWEEAYGLLADALIAAEKALYAAHHTTPGEFYEFQVTQIQPEGTEVKAYSLMPVGNTPHWAFHPGQYVSVAVTLDNGQRQLRQYSLSDAPGASGLRISVKREPNRGDTPAGQVSNWIHEQVQVGSVLLLSPPCGDFSPAVGRDPVVLLSAGIGITPMVSALNHIAQTQPERYVQFAHAALNSDHHAHQADIAAAQARMPHLQVVTFYEEPTVADLAAGIYSGRMEITKLPSWAYHEAAVYLCGPIGFMQSQWQQLLALGVPAHLLHREVFGPELLDHLL